MPTNLLSKNVSDTIIRRLKTESANYRKFYVSSITQNNKLTEENEALRKKVGKLVSENLDLRIEVKELKKIIKTMEK